MTSLSLHRLASLLSKNLGDEKALSLVTDTASTLGFGGEELTQQQALTLFERLAEEPGIAGITARFAKARLHMIDTKPP